MRLFDLALLLTGIALGAPLQAANDLADLVGAKAAGGETQLNARGYEYANAGKGAIHYWNAEKSRCVAVTTRDGRFSAIKETASSACGTAASQGKRHKADQGKEKGAESRKAAGNVSDLVGGTEMASSEKIEQRGFVLVDGNQSGPFSNKWYFNRKSHQCLLMEIKENKVLRLNPSENANCN